MFIKKSLISLLTLLLLGACGGGDGSTTTESGEKNVEGDTSGKKDKDIQEGDGKSAEVGPFDQNGCLIPSKKVVSQNRDPVNFDRIAAFQIADVSLTQGAQYSVRVEADDNLISETRTLKEGDSLKIDIDPAKFPNKTVCFNGTATYRVNITLPLIEVLEAQGSSSITEKTSIPPSGQVAELRTGGSSLIQVVGIKVNTLKVTAQGSSMFHVDQIDTVALITTLSGSSQTTLMGKVENHTLDLSGSRQLSAENLASKKVTATLSGSSNAEISVSEELNATTQGSSILGYRGSPGVLNTSMSGSSQVIQR